MADIKLLNNGEQIKENDQRLFLNEPEDIDAMHEGIIVWGRVDKSLVGETYTFDDNGIIRRVE